MQYRQDHVTDGEKRAGANWLMCVVADEFRCLLDIEHRTKSNSQILLNSFVPIVHFNRHAWNLHLKLRINEKKKMFCLSRS